MNTSFTSPIYPERQIWSQLHNEFVVPSCWRSSILIWANTRTKKRYYCVRAWPFCQWLMPTWLNDPPNPIVQTCHLACLTWRATQSFSIHDTNKTSMSLFTSPKGIFPEKICLVEYERSALKSYESFCSPRSIHNQRSRGQFLGYYAPLRSLHLCRLSQGPSIELCHLETQSCQSPSKWLGWLGWITQNHTDKLSGMK